LTAIDFYDQTCCSNTLKGSNCTVQTFSVRHYGHQIFSAWPILFDVNSYKVSKCITYGNPTIE